MNFRSDIINNMINLNCDIVKKAFLWNQEKTGISIIHSRSYCSTRDIFFARLDKLRTELEKHTRKTNIPSLISAITGEIGNNSYDHNLGSWRDTPGIYFAYDLTQKIIVLADRGQGIHKTIKKVKPQVKDDFESLKVAFTEKISGRAPEFRGNGLKFTVQVAQDYKFNLYFQSGKAVAKIYESNYKLAFEKNGVDIKGTLAIIKY